MFYRNIFKWESQFSRPRLLEVSLSFRDRDSQKSVSVSRLRLGNCWGSRQRPRLGYEQLSRKRPLDTGPWMSKRRWRQRFSLISGWYAFIAYNKHGYAISSWYSCKYTMCKLSSSSHLPIPLLILHQSLCIDLRFGYILLCHFPPPSPPLSPSTETEFNTPWVIIKWPWKNRRRNFLGHLIHVMGAKKCV